MTGYLVLAVVSYLVGAVPFGYLVARAVAGVDVRTVGSGNIGATNVRRAAGNLAGLAVLLLDIAKGFVPARFFAGWLFPDLPTTTAQVVCGAGAILGHVFTVFLRFRGGKGVATGCGVAFGLAPLEAALALVVFVVVVAVWRYISLGSMTAVVVFWVSLLVLGEDPWGEGLALTVLAGAMAVLVIARHRSNIQRLLAGTEHKLGQDRAAPPPSHAQTSSDAQTPSDAQPPDES